MTDLTQSLTSLPVPGVTFIVIWFWCFAFTHSCLCTCMYVWMHVEARDQCQECPSITSHLILETVSHRMWSTGRLTGHESPGTLPMEMSPSFFFFYDSVED